MRVAAYARYSSDLQREASIEDQIRLCKERVEREGWTHVETYADYGMSGSSTLLRSGIQSLMRDGMAGKFDLVIAEALDRLSRDQEDIAALYKRLNFAGVTLFTISEGEINELHVGLKGTMNALFLKELGNKTRRGLRGRVEHGKAAGGLTYGYEAVKRIDERGEYARGERTIDEEQAAVVRRIFADYVRGQSPRAIAVALNKEGVAGPMGGAWGASTIYGNRQRGTGILNNELYIGKLIWNRLRYMKDPNTGRRVSRPNPDSEVVIKDLPELRIIDQEIWDAVKRLQGVYNKQDRPLWTKNRPKNLFSNLIRCGCCGGGFSMVSADALGCSTARNKGTCTNRRTMKREVLEHAVLGALRDHLMDEELCVEFCREYTRRMNELRTQHNASLNGYRTELAKLERERQSIVKSICDGVPGEVVRDRAIYVQRRKEELERLLSTLKEAPVLFHPNMANRYQKEIRNLIASLNDQASRTEAATILRSLIDRIVVTPDEANDRLTVDLVGDLAGILSIASNRGREAVTADLSNLQPVQNASADTDQHPSGTADNRGSRTGDDEDGTGSQLPQVALVAGGPNSRDFAQVAMVAGMHPRHHLGGQEKTPEDRGFSAEEAMVAGAYIHLHRTRLIWRSRLSR